MGRENEKSNITQMFRENKGHSLKTLLLLFRGRYLALFWIQFSFFVIKHSLLGAANRHSKYYQCSDR